MISIKEYVEGLFSDVPDSEEKSSIIQEIVSNLEEKVTDLVDSGKDEEDAINKSIVDLGDVSEIKKDLIGAAMPKKKKKPNYLNNLWFSIWGSALVIGLMLFINFYYSPRSIWFVYPTFAILWWPLAMFFRWLNKGKKAKNE